MASAAALKTVADIPTISQLYRSSALGQPSLPSSPAFPPSAAVNAIVGLVQADITKLRLDAIVNAANTSLLGGGGVDGAIHRAAGPDLLTECRRLGGCPTGQARISGGYRLPAKHILHTVGPIYDRADPQKSERLLRSCYQECLSLAASRGIKTLAFSAISTGVYAYPSRDAAEVACLTLRTFLDRNTDVFERIIFVTFGDKDTAVYHSVLPKYFPPAD